MNRRQTATEISHLQVRYRALTSLRPNPQNPRLHNDKQIKQIARSIEAFGFNVPLLVDQNLQVVAGHGRLEAAKILALLEVPTISLEHLTKIQVKAFGIADNRLNENSEWDERLLAQQLKLLSEAELDFNLETIGFEVAEIDAHIEGLSAPDKGDDDPADVLPAEGSSPVTRVGDLWLLNRHRVLCDNSLNDSSFRLLMENRKAAMVFVDPPYNVPIEHHVGGLGSIKHREFAMASGEMTSGEFTDFLAQAFRLLTRYSFDGSIHFVCGDWRHLREFLNAGCETYFELKNLCIWTKDNAGMGSFYRSQHELVFVWKSGQASHRNNFQLGQFGRYRTNVWSYGGANSFSRNTAEGNLLELHPTVKPVALIADAVMDVSSRGDIVLDSFLGSGSAVIACERTGRICYGIEIDTTYVDIIVRRWQAFTGLSARHALSGLTFDEVEQEANIEQRRK